MKLTFYKANIRITFELVFELNNRKLNKNYVLENNIYLYKQNIST